jgi:hypothetical protein
MRVLVACEESQTVCKAFRKLGHEAFSCDILPCSGGHPEWHIQDDVLKHLDDGWDLMIAHPPCTHLAVSGARWFTEGRKPKKLQEDSLEFVRELLNAPIQKICIENPVSVISSKIRKPDQIIQPYQFGHEVSKTTCLWLKNLTKLQHTDVVGKGPIHVTRSGKKMSMWWLETFKLPAKERSKVRSKTFQGIADAMALQWGGECKEISPPKAAKE